MKSNVIGKILRDSKLSNLFIRRVSDIDDKFLKGISRVQIEVTNNCNLNCRICWRALRDELAPVRNMAFSAFKKAMDNLMGIFDIRELNTQGLGEPFMCPDILDILKYAKSIGLSTWLVTNGTLLDEHMAETLVEIGVDKLRFSVDSADSRIYSAIKSGSNIAVVARNISRINLFKDKLGRKNPAVSFNSVVMKSAFEGLEELIEMADKLKVGEVTLIPLVLFSRGLAVKDEQVDFYDGEFNDRARLLKELASQADIELNLGTSLESRGDKFCHSGFYIDVDGFIHPCCNISSRNFGNAYGADARSIAAEYLSFRRWLDNKKISCKECNMILDGRC